MIAGLELESMPTTDSNFTRCNLRVPQSLYEKIEAIAIANGAKINSRSKRPQISSTLIELLHIGLEYYAQVNSVNSEDILPVTPATEEKDLTASIKDQESEPFHHLSQMLEKQQQSQQTIEQHLIQIQASQQFTQVDINHLYHVVGQLCDRLQVSTMPEMVLNSPPQLRDDQPEAANLDQWTVNRQWLSANGCFSEDSFNNWQNREVRQDQQGRYWRRVELANVLGEFEIPSSLATSQIFYVLEDHH